MLPLAAEFKRTIGYRITDAGRTALHMAGASGSSARSRRTPQEQLAEFRVLDYLGERELAREEALRAATRISKSVLAGMVHKKWIVREDLSDSRDAERTVKVALLKTTEGKLNANQRTLIDTLAKVRVIVAGKLSVRVSRNRYNPKRKLGARRARRCR